MPAIWWAGHLHFECLKMPKSKKLEISVREGGGKKARELKCLNLNALIACKDKNIYIFKLGWTLKSLRERGTFRTKTLLRHTRDNEPFKLARRQGWMQFYPKWHERLNKCCQALTGNSSLDPEILLRTEGFSQLRCTVGSTAPCWHGPACALMSV